MKDILNEIESNLKELVRETDEMYDKFLFEGYDLPDDATTSPLPLYGDHLNSISEATYKVYHGTNHEFDRFDFKKTAQGIVWFTDSVDSIKSGEHGGNGSKYIMTRYITINNPAGWDEYEKYGLQQLEDMGYDGVILPQGDKTDYFVFNNKSIKKSGPKELNETVYARAILNGHPISLINPPGDWRYDDTGDKIKEVPQRPCKNCEKATTKDGHDACIANLPGVKNACCGHGTGCGYLHFDDNTTIYQKEQPRLYNQKLKELIGKRDAGELSEVFVADDKDKSWAIFRVSKGYGKCFVIELGGSDKKMFSRCDYRTKYSDPTVLKFGLEQAKDLIRRNIGIDERLGVVNSAGVQKLFSWRIKYPNKYDDQGNELNENTEYYENKFPEVFAELNALDDKTLKVKEQEFYDEYSRVNRWGNDQAKADELLTQVGMIRQMLEDRKRNKYNATYEKFIGQPFLGSKIEEILLPDLTEGDFKTLKIFLVDEGEFEYDSGISPEFKYFKYLGEDQDSIYIHQKTDRPVQPNEAILTRKELDLLNLIIRFNNTSHTKIPYPRNATVKDDTSGGPQKPELQSADLQWMVGQGGNEHKISEVRVSNNTTTEGYSSAGFIHVYITVEDLKYNSPFVSKHFTYYVGYDSFFKPTEEKLDDRIGIGDATETKYIDKDVYEPIMKAIQQVNPQTKLLNKIRSYS